MRIQSPRLYLLAILFSSLTSMAGAASQFKIDIQPVFEGELPNQGIIPLRVEIQNSGADAHGELRVDSDNSSTTYPIELPRGANKKLFVYPTVGYSDAQFELTTDQGNLPARFEMRSPRSDSMHVLVIGDNLGELSFIHGTNDLNLSSQATTGLDLTDCYVRPVDAPARAMGYDGVSSIILGSGAERLSDEAVEAIKLWVINGKTLVFLGGASAPILSDKRWADLLPARDFRVVELGASQLLANLAATPTPSITISTGIVNPGSTARTERGFLVTAERPYGLGKVTYLAFDPFEAPLNKWSGRKQALTKLLRVTDSLAANSYLGSFGGQISDPNSYTSSSFRPRPMGTGGPGAPAYPAPPPGIAGFGYSPGSDPFDAKLPPTQKILTILVSYFVVVVPLNFLVLKKLKRGELAWFTAPIISLGFAGLLFTSASSLYGAKMSTVSRGIIVGQDGNSECEFIGSTQMFIPTSGLYDLKLSGVDSIYSNTSSYRGNSESDSIEAVDNGEMHIPNLQANNLAFSKLAYSQHVPTSGLFRVQLMSTGSTTARCSIANTGPYRLLNAVLDSGHTQIALGDLKPGDVKTVPVSFSDAGQIEDLPPNDARIFTIRKKRVALTGTISGFRPGPQLGEDLVAKSSVSVLLFSGWEQPKP